LRLRGNGEMANAVNTPRQEANQMWSTVGPDKHERIWSFKSPSLCVIYLEYWENRKSECVCAVVKMAIFLRFLVRIEELELM
jgi:hypothetical protein